MKGGKTNFLSEIAQEAQKTKSNFIPLPNTTNAELDKLLKGAEIHPTDKIPEPTPCLQIINNGIKIIIGSYGEFILLIGKAKSRKTFLVTLFFSIVAGYQLDKFVGNLQPGQVGLYFDTEQGNYYVHKVLTRICRLINKPIPDNLKVFSLRKFNPAQRLAIIEHAIYTIPNIGIVVIDGIRDLVTSINDEEQATSTTTKLLRWTEEKNIHLLTVLHQNKSDNNARGHLGTELVNKAQTVLSIAKSEDDKAISIVEAEQCRDMDFEPFAFTVDFEGLPKIVDTWEQAKPQGKKQIFNPITDVNIFTTLSKCFSGSGNEKISHGKLEKQIQYFYKELFGEKLTNAITIELITKSRNSGWIIQQKERLPYELGRFKE